MLSLALNTITEIGEVIILAPAALIVLYTL